MNSRCMVSMVLAVSLAGGGSARALLGDGDGGGWTSGAAPVEPSPQPAAVAGGSLRVRARSFDPVLDVPHYQNAQGEGMNVAGGGSCYGMSLLTARWFWTKHRGGPDRHYSPEQFADLRGLTLQPPNHALFKRWAEALHYRHQIEVASPTIVVNLARGAAAVNLDSARQALRDAGEDWVTMVSLHATSKFGGHVMVVYGGELRSDGSMELECYDSNFPPVESGGQVVARPTRVQVGADGSMTAAQGGERVYAGFSMVSALAYRSRLATRWVDFILGDLEGAEEWNRRFAETFNQDSSAGTRAKGGAGLVWKTVKDAVSSMLP